MLDAAGQVFEWTATGDGRYEVKGGSWDDRGCGVCRPATAHMRPEDLRHILIGFRLVRSLNFLTLHHNPPDSFHQQDNLPSSTLA